ncbi:endonuclease dU [Haladaptatus sp. NG-SE-30]
MKPGVRALGVAESYAGDTSTLAGVVARASRVVDGFVFGSCTVGGTDVSESVVDLAERLDREDVRYVLVSGIALAWYNVLDMHRVHEAVERPVISVTFEESDGLTAAIDAEFSGDERERRREVYRRQPPRRELAVNDQTVFARSVGVDEREARDVVRAFTPEGGRPEPIRVARMAARAADEWRAEGVERYETGR